ncbi:FAD binding domain-containing protein [Desulfocicer niacini]
MRKFKHINAGSIDEAVSILQQNTGKAVVIAGGTDLLGCLREDIWPEQPRIIINIKRIPGLNYIKEEAGLLKIGALTTLVDIAESKLIIKRYASLAQAALKTASPSLRNLGTLVGNICQENRCWYYRYPQQLGGRIECVRKGGKKCLAVTGDHRYHSIFGAVNKCIAVNPSDTAPALMVLNADIKTSKRIIAIEDFFTSANGMKSTVLEPDEIVTEIQIPVPGATTRSAFIKYAMRQSIDFPIVNSAVCLKIDANIVQNASIAINAVFCDPLRVPEAENFLCGKELSEEVAEQAAEKAVVGARPLIMNSYKVQIAKTLVKDAICACWSTNCESIGEM